MDCLRYDFDVLQGSTFARDLEYQIQGEPVDIEGYTAKMKVRKSYELPVEIELTTANQRIIISDTNRIDIQLTAAETASITAGRYLYDLELVNGDYVERILQGVFTVMAEVTK
jgi:hypothetical protein